jgi:glycosyltransferase involved in cell wall biosynthesis
VSINTFEYTQPGSSVEAAAFDIATAPSVLFVDQSGQPGGAELCLLPLAELYAARSEVLLLSPGPFRARLEALGVRVQVASNTRVAAIDRRAFGLNWLRAIPGVIGQIRTIASRARHFDLLYLNTQKAFVLGALGKPLHRRPVIWHVHDIMTPEHFGPVQMRIVRWLVLHATDRVIANSRATADALIALTGESVETVPVVHNGIDASAFEQLDWRPGKVNTSLSKPYPSCRRFTWCWWARRCLAKISMLRHCIGRPRNWALQTACILPASATISLPACRQ